MEVFNFSRLAWSDPVSVSVFGFGFAQRANFFSFVNYSENTVGYGSFTLRDLQQDFYVRLNLSRLPQDFVLRCKYTGACAKTDAKGYEHTGSCNF